MVTAVLENKRKIWNDKDKLITAEVVKQELMIDSVVFDLTKSDWSAKRSWINRHLCRMCVSHANTSCLGPLGPTGTLHTSVCAVVAWGFTLSTSTAPRGSTSTPLPANKSVLGTTPEKQRGFFSLFDLMHFHSNDSTESGSEFISEWETNNSLVKPLTQFYAQDMRRGKWELKQTALCANTNMHDSDRQKNSNSFGLTVNRFMRFKPAARQEC